MASRTRTEAACLAASIRRLRGLIYAIDGGYTNTRRAAEHLASLTPERREQLFREWEA